MEAQALKIKDTTSTKRIFRLRKRIRAVAGGTSASKTVSILVWFIDYAQSTRYKTMDIVSESFPHLERGAMADFQMIMKDRGYWDESRWHGTKHMYTFEGGTTIRFTSVDTYGKAHGPRRDVLFVNEANNLAYNIVDQLITRTREIVWLDWNPSEEFWFYTEMLPKRDDIDFITLTYLDNEALDEATVKEIESHKDNKAWWTVYGLGQLGAIESRIYTGWTILEDIPEDARLRCRWLDWGYTNDPTSMGDVYEWQGGLVLDQLLYQTRMSNDDIGNTMKNLARIPTIADSSEPKSIDALKAMGYNVIGAAKGPGSINQGIEVVQAQKIYITKRSLESIKEYRNYLFITDRDGKITNDPEPGNDHSMDGIRYAVQWLKAKPMVFNAVQTRGVAPMAGGVGF